MEGMTTDNCPICGDRLELHIGGKPCTGRLVPETKAERQARRVREQDRKRIVRLFGEDAE
jgi:hypothetical protein